MATNTVYAIYGADGFVVSGNASYPTARKGGTLTAYANGLNIGQIRSDAAHYCQEAFVSFDTSGINGSVDSMSLGLWRSAAGNWYSWGDQPFTLRARVLDYGAGVTDADWVDGALLPNYPLAGTLSSGSFVRSGYSTVTITAHDGDIVADAYAFVLSSDKHETGVPLPAPPVSGTTGGGVFFKNSSASGTANDPKLVIVSGNNPSDCTINSPAHGSYDGIIDLTATATAPNGGNITYVWDYSTDGGANWSACAESPSDATASGTAGTITFDTTIVAMGALIDLRVRAYDGALYSFDYATVQIARNTQTGTIIYRTAGTDIMAYPVSGLTITRPTNGPSSCSFTVDNFDATEAGIADDDELLVTVPYYELGSIGSYTWRGFVREKRAGDIMDVSCQDIAYRFAGLLVTRTDLVGEQTVGTIVKAIVENPTASDATGITATCAEVEDPASAGNYLAVTDFNADGRRRPLLDWLNELADWTGAKWYVYHDGTVWQFVWFDPSANAAWAVACKDNIDFAAESTSQARVLNSPVVTKSRQQYINRVWYWYDLRTTATGSSTADSTYSESTTPWSVLNGGATIATDGTNKTAGSYSVKFTDTSYHSNDLCCLLLTMDAADYDWSVASKQYFKFDLRWTCDQEVSLIQPGAMLVSGATAPTSYANVTSLPFRNPIYGYLPQPMPEGGFSVVTVDAVSQYLGSTRNGFSLSDVRYVVVNLFAYTAATSTLTLWIDNVRWDTEGDYELPDNEPIWTLGKVETAAVTAGTEEPVETILSTRLLDYSAAASLAQGYLDAYARTRLGVERVEIFGIREVALDRDVTLTLAGRGITATAYPINSIEYRPYDSGHVTALSLGDPVLAMQGQMERLVRRLQDVTAEVRS